MSVKKFVIQGILAVIAMSLITVAETAGASANMKPGSGGKEEKPLLPFFEIQSLKIWTRYNFIANDQGVITKNHQQHKESFSFRLRFDREGDFSLCTAGGSGSSLTSSWDSLGIGSDASSKINFRELYLSVKPVKGLHLQYGGISFARGAATEITTYSNNAYLMGARITIKSPGNLFFDEITGTLAYLGDIAEPNVFQRFDRLNEANYHQVLITKKIGKRAFIGGEYSSLSGVAVLRQAVQVNIPELKVMDSVRFENYQRIEGQENYGYAFQADKKLHKKLALSGGFADIDRFYGGLNSDRFNKGKRLFAQVKIDILKSLNAEVFIQKAVANSYPISNDVRLDLALIYDLLPDIRKLGVFRTNQ